MKGRHEQCKPANELRQKCWANPYSQGIYSTALDVSSYTSNLPLSQPLFPSKTTHPLNEIPPCQYHPPLPFHSLPSPPLPISLLPTTPTLLSHPNSPVFITLSHSHIPHLANHFLHHSGGPHQNLLTNILPTSCSAAHVACTPVTLSEPALLAVCTAHFHPCTV